MSRKLEKQLREHGVTVGVDAFRDALADAKYQIAPSWNDEELAAHLEDALRFCARVRCLVNAPELPSHVIMRALAACRKRSIPV